MTARWLAVALACLGAAAPGTAAAAADEMTFDRALAAASQGPRLARLAADVAVAKAALVAAETYPHNPVLEVEAADRSGADGATTDRSVALSQPLELAGQRGERRAAAEADLAAARAAFEQARVAVLGQAALAFARAVHRRELLAVEETEAELVRSFASMVERRLDAGSATAVALALAQAGLARAERGLALATGAYRTAQARLAEVVGGSGAALAAPAGDLPPLRPPPALDAVLAAAVARRGDLAAAGASIEAAEARRRLARSLRYPDLTVGARVGREEGDDLVGIGVAVPLPLFDRNQGGVAEAEAELAAARTDLAVAELVVRREVAAAHGRLTAALEARRLTERLGVTPLEDGLALLERSFEAGKIGAAELLLYRRELVEGRRQAVEALGEAWEAAVELAVAAGGALPGTAWTDWTVEPEVEP
jgi:cobalt-zinc-cadmium efflux system outer membrane protein